MPLKKSRRTKGFRPSPSPAVVEQEQRNDLSSPEEERAAAADPIPETEEPKSKAKKLKKMHLLRRKQAQKSSLAKIPRHATFAGNVARRGILAILPSVFQFCYVLLSFLTVHHDMRDRPLRETGC